MIAAGSQLEIAVHRGEWLASSLPVHRGSRCARLQACDRLPHRFSHHGGLSHASRSIAASTASSERSIRTSTLLVQTDEPRRWKNVQPWQLTQHSTWLRLSTYMLPPHSPQRVSPVSRYLDFRASLRPAPQLTFCPGACWLTASTTNCRSNGSPTSEVEMNMVSPARALGSRARVPGSRSFVTLSIPTTAAVLREPLQLLRDRAVVRRRRNRPGRLDAVSEMEERTDMGWPPVEGRRADACENTQGSSAVYVADFLLRSVCGWQPADASFSRQRPSLATTPRSLSEPALIPEFHPILDLSKSVHQTAVDSKGRNMCWRHSCISLYVNCYHNRKCAACRLAIMPDRPLCRNPLRSCVPESIDGKAIEPPLPPSFLSAWCVHPSDRCAEFQERTRLPPTLPTLLLCPIIAWPWVLFQSWQVASPCSSVPSAFEPVRMSWTPAPTKLPRSSSDVLPPSLLRRHGDHQDFPQSVGPEH